MSARAGSASKVLRRSAVTSCRLILLMISWSLNKRQRATLETVFRNPVPQNIRWADIESLVKALGGTVREREGSRVAFKLNGVRSVFHRPHPNPNSDRNSIRDLRDFLKRAGVTS